MNYEWTENEANVSLTTVSPSGIEGEIFFYRGPDLYITAWTVHSWVQTNYDEDPGEVEDVVIEMESGIKMTEWEAKEIVGQRLDEYEALISTAIRYRDGQRLEIV